MVGVDLQADADLFGIIHTLVGGNTAQRLGEGHRCTAVEQAKRLDRALVNGHPGSNKVIAHGGVFDTQLFGERAVGIAVEGSNVWWREPDGHECFLVERGTTDVHAVGVKHPQREHRSSC